MPKVTFFPLNPFTLTVRGGFEETFEQVRALAQEREEQGLSVSQIGLVAGLDRCQLFAQAVCDDFLGALKQRFGDKVEEFSRPDRGQQLVYTNMDLSDFLNALKALGDQGILFASGLGEPVKHTQLAMRRGKGLTKESSLLWRVPQGLMQQMWERRHDIFAECLELKQLDSTDNPILLIFYQPPSYEGHAGKLKGWPVPPAPVERQSF